MKLKTLGSLLVETYNAYSRDKGSRMAAALAYYTIFSIAPLLLISVAIASFALGPKVAKQDVAAELQSLMGEAGAAAVQSIVKSANHPASGTLAVSVGFIVLFFGASGVFAELQDDLDTIWKAPPPESGGLWRTVKSRFLAFCMVLGIGFLLLLSLIASAALAALGNLVHGFLPQSQFIAQALDVVLSVAVISLLFAMVFKILPNIPIAWSDVALGSILSSILFTVGKHALGLYLGRSAVASSYGAAGTLAVVLLWTYYSAMIFLYGAEFTAAYSRWRSEGEPTRINQKD